jgi:hypothetical protein
MATARHDKDSLEGKLRTAAISWLATRGGALALLVSLVALGCQPSVGAHGFVRDESGHAIPGAAVSLTPSGTDPRPVNGTTDSSGAFTLERIGGYRLPIQLRVCRDGFREARRDFPTEIQLNNSLYFVLVPDTGRTGKSCALSVHVQTAPSRTSSS